MAREGAILVIALFTLSYRLTTQSVILVSVDNHASMHCLNSGKEIFAILRSIADYLALLLLAQGIEPNPGPMSYRPIDDNKVSKKRQSSADRGSQEWMTPSKDPTEPPQTYVDSTHQAMGPTSTNDARSKVEDGEVEATNPDCDEDILYISDSEHVIQIDEDDMNMLFRRGPYARQTASDSSSDDDSTSDSESDDDVSEDASDGEASIGDDKIAAVLPFVQNNNAEKLHRHGPAYTGQSTSGPSIDDDICVNSTSDNESDDDVSEDASDDEASMGDDKNAAVMSIVQSNDAEELHRCGPAYTRQPISGSSMDDDFCVNPSSDSAVDDNVIGDETCIVDDKNAEGLSIVRKKDVQKLQRSTVQKEDSLSVSDCPDASDNDNKDILQASTNHEDNLRVPTSRHDATDCTNPDRSLSSAHDPSEEVVSEDDTDAMSDWDEDTPSNSASKHTVHSDEDDINTLSRHDPTNTRQTKSGPSMDDGIRVNTSSNCKSDDDVFVNEACIGGHKNADGLASVEKQDVQELHRSTVQKDDPLSVPDGHDASDNDKNDILQASTNHEDNLRVPTSRHDATDCTKPDRSLSSAHDPSEEVVSEDDTDVMSDWDEDTASNSASNHTMPIDEDNINTLSRSAVQRDDPPDVSDGSDAFDNDKKDILQASAIHEDSLGVPTISDDATDCNRSPSSIDDCIKVDDDVNALSDWDEDTPSNSSSQYMVHTECDDNNNPPRRDPRQLTSGSRTDDEIGNKNKPNNDLIDDKASTEINTIIKSQPNEDDSFAKEVYSAPSSTKDASPSAEIATDDEILSDWDEDTTSSPASDLVVHICEDDIVVKNSEDDADFEIVDILPSDDDSKVKELERPASQTYATLPTSDNPRATDKSKNSNLTACPDSTANDLGAPTVRHHATTTDKCGRSATQKCTLATSDIACVIDKENCNELPACTRSMDNSGQSTSGHDATITDKSAVNGDHTNVETEEEANSNGDKDVFETERMVNKDEEETNDLFRKGPSSTGVCMVEDFHNNSGSKNGDEKDAERAVKDLNSSPSSAKDPCPLLESASDTDIDSDWDEDTTSSSASDRVEHIDTDDVDVLSGSADPKCKLATSDNHCTISNDKNNHLPESASSVKMFEQSTVGRDATTTDKYASSPSSAKDTFPSTEIVADTAIDSNLDEDKTSSSTSEHVVQIDANDINVLYSSAVPICATLATSDTSCAIDKDKNNDLPLCAVSTDNSEQSTVRQDATTTDRSPSPMSGDHSNVETEDETDSDWDSSETEHTVYEALPRSGASLTRTKEECAASDNEDDFTAVSISDDDEYYDFDFLSDDNSIESLPYDDDDTDAMKVICRTEVQKKSVTFAPTKEVYFFAMDSSSDDDSINSVSYDSSDQDETSMSDDDSVESLPLDDDGDVNELHRRNVDLPVSENEQDSLSVAGAVDITATKSPDHSESVSAIEFTSSPDNMSQCSTIEHQESVPETHDIPQSASPQDAQLPPQTLDIVQSTLHKDVSTDEHLDTVLEKAILDSDIAATNSMIRSFDNLDVTTLIRTDVKRKTVTFAREDKIFFVENYIASLSDDDSTQSLTLDSNCEDEAFWSDDDSVESLPVDDGHVDELNRKVIDLPMPHTAQNTEPVAEAVNTTTTEALDHSELVTATETTSLPINVSVPELSDSPLHSLKCETPTLHPEMSIKTHIELTEMPLVKSCLEYTDSPIDQQASSPDPFDERSQTQHMEIQNTTSSSDSSAKHQSSKSIDIQSITSTKDAFITESPIIRLDISTKDSDSFQEIHAIEHPGPRAETTDIARSASAHDIPAESSQISPPQVLDVVQSASNSYTSDDEFSNTPLEINDIESEMRSVCSMDIPVDSPGVTPLCRNEIQKKSDIFATDQDQEVHCDDNKTSSSDDGNIERDKAKYEGEIFKSVDDRVERLPIDKEVVIEIQSKDVGLPLSQIIQTPASDITEIKTAGQSELETESKTTSLHMKMSFTKHAKLPLDMVTDGKTDRILDMVAANSLPASPDISDIEDSDLSLDLPDDRSPPTLCNQPSPWSLVMSAFKPEASSLDTAAKEQLKICQYISATECSDTMPNMYAKQTPIIHQENLKIAPTSSAYESSDVLFDIKSSATSQDRCIQESEVEDRKLIDIDSFVSSMDLSAAKPAISSEFSPTSLDMPVNKLTATSLDITGIESDASSLNMSAQQKHAAVSVDNEPSDVSLVGSNNESYDSPVDILDIGSSFHDISAYEPSFLRQEIHQFEHPTSLSDMSTDGPASSQLSMSSIASAGVCFGVSAIASSAASCEMFDADMSKTFLNSLANEHSTALKVNVDIAQTDEPQDTLLEISDFELASLDQPTNRLATECLKRLDNEHNSSLRNLSVVNHQSTTEAINANEPQFGHQEMFDIAHTVPTPDIYFESTLDKTDQICNNKSIASDLVESTIKPEALILCTTDNEPPLAPQVNHDITFSLQNIPVEKPPDIPAEVLDIETPISTLGLTAKIPCAFPTEITVIKSVSSPENGLPVAPVEVLGSQLSRPMLDEVANEPPSSVIEICDIQHSATSLCIQDQESSNTSVQLLDIESQTSLILDKSTPLLDYDPLETLATPVKMVSENANDLSLGASDAHELDQRVIKSKSQGTLLVQSQDIYRREKPNEDSFVDRSLVETLNSAKPKSRKRTRPIAKQLKRDKDQKQLDTATTSTGNSALPAMSQSCTKHEVDSEKYKDLSASHTEKVETKSSYDKDGQYLNKGTLDQTEQRIDQECVMAMGSLSSTCFDKSASHSHKGSGENQPMVDSYVETQTSTKSINRKRKWQARSKRKKSHKAEKQLDMTNKSTEGSFPHLSASPSTTNGDRTEDKSSMKTSPSELSDKLKSETQNRRKTKVLNRQQVNEQVNLGNELVGIGMFFPSVFPSVHEDSTTRGNCNFERSNSVEILSNLVERNGNINMVLEKNIKTSDLYADIKPEYLSLFTPKLTKPKIMENKAVKAPTDTADKKKDNKSRITGFLRRIFK